MGMIRDILAQKGSSTVITQPRTASVLDAVRCMTDNRIGAVVVLGEGRVAGIFTERDVVRRVLAADMDLRGTTLAEVMTSEVVCCTPGTSIEEARSAMKNRRLRHLPVVDDAGRLAGVISIGDLNAWQATEQEQTISMMHEYLYGRV